MQRWERAKFLGLNPPTTVQDLLLKYNKDPFVIYRSVYYVSTLSTLLFVLKKTIHQREQNYEKWHGLLG